MELIDLVKSFLEYGIFAALFIYLFLSSQKKNESREQSYLTIIDSFGDKLSENTKTLEKIVGTLSEITEELKK